MPITAKDKAPCCSFFGISRERPNADTLRMERRTLSPAMPVVTMTRTSQRDRGREDRTNRTLCGIYLMDADCGKVRLLLPETGALHALA